MTVLCVLSIWKALCCFFETDSEGLEVGRFQRMAMEPCGSHDALFGWGRGSVTCGYVRDLWFCLQRAILLLTGRCWVRVESILNYGSGLAADAHGSAIFQSPNVYVAF